MEQRPNANSESTLRRLIDEIKSGAPNYDQMRPELAQIVRNQLPQLQQSLNQFGGVQAVRFKSVGAAGDDVFDITFERAEREFNILLRPDGRIHAARFVP